MIDVNRVKRQIAWQHSRARSAGATSTLNEEEWIMVLEDCQGKCFYCRKKTELAELTIDHIDPITRGGSNTKSNVVAACFRCNCRKGNRASPDIEQIRVDRIADDEVVLWLGAHRIRLFDREVETLIELLAKA